jgi:phage gp36-like protein
MTYATQANITSELKGIVFDSSSQVKAADITEFLDQADAQIDMYIGKRYDTPVTGTKSLNILKKIAIDIVVYRVTKILDLSKSTPIPEAGVVQDITEGSAYRESMKMLVAIRDNIMSLPDATLANAVSGLGSFHTESANSDITPVFDRELQQW